MYVPGLRGMVILLALGVFFLGLAAPTRVGATHRGEGIIDATSLELAFERSAQRGIADRLVARLLAVDGAPVVGVEVEFVREIDFLGPRRVLLGRAVTDTAGVARVAVVPTSTDERILVRFRGNEHFEAIERVEVVAIPAESVRHEPARHSADGGTGASLRPIANVMPALLATATAIIWLVLIGLAGMTVRAMRGDPLPARLPGMTGGSGESPRTATRDGSTVEKRRSGT